MKDLLFLVSFFCVSQTLAAQKLFSVQYQNQADLKIFVVDHANQADLKVFKVDYSNRAQGNNH